MTDVIRFTNGFLAMPDGSAVKADLYISSTSGLIISGQSSFFDSHTPPARVIDLNGNILSPGLIDVQINGAFGVDFSELNTGAVDGGEGEYVEGLEKVSREIVQTGCTSYVPTVITQKEELYSKLLRLLQPRSTPQAAHILGYHAEGPFLHPHRRGAHSSALLMTASPSCSAHASPTTSPQLISTPFATVHSPMNVLERVYGKSSIDQPGVKLITLAPDVEGVMECVEDLSKRGVTVSIGHSDASLEVATMAVEKGARMITHLFNAMPPIHHRDPGVIGLLGSANPSHRPYFGLIVDGLHSHPNTVRIAYGAHKDGCVVVTDAQSPLDPKLADGLHYWRPGVMFRKKGDAVYAVYDDVPGETLAGSCAPLNTCLHNLSTYASIPFPEALIAATYRPAQMLGGEIARTKGQLKEGFHADLVVLGWDGSVKSTWVAGEEVYRNPEVGDGNWMGKRKGKETNGYH